jgi:DNA mismatch repair protein MutS
MAKIYRNALKSQSSGDTPLMKQYNAIKAKYPDTLLLFRVGDFYETFGQDAVTAARILGIILTKRSSGYASELELAGFPYHSLDTYLPKLVKAGQRVAVCEQLEDPKLAKGIVKRGVQEIVTPGIALSDRVLESQHPNYLVALHRSANKAQPYAAGFCDVSTGDWFYTTGTWEVVEKIINNFLPSELLVQRAYHSHFVELLGEERPFVRLDDWAFEPAYATECLNTHFQTYSLKGLGIDEDPGAAIVLGVLLHYLRQMEQHNLRHLIRVYRFQDEHFVSLDRFTVRNLELVQPSYEGGTSLLQVLNQTTTPMGARLLKRWLLFPLQNRAKIEQRLNAVQALLQAPGLNEQLRSAFKEMGDLERSLARLATLKLTPREACQLRKGLQLIPVIHEALTNSAQPALDGFAQFMKPMAPAIEILANRLFDECPVQLEKGSVIRPGVHAELDDLRSLKTDAEAYLNALREREAQRTGIPSLKISYNTVFGYYIEITHAHRAKVPDDYLRKQTLTNAERYITPELKTFEEKILTANDRILQLETELYHKLLQDLQAHVADIQHNAQLLAGLDVLSGFAVQAERRGYCRPVLTEAAVTRIRNGRHPVIETLLKPDNPYIPSDIELDNQTQQILLITGPNMAGKSAILRQTALITLLAQIGSYVPAEAAEIGLTDRIFSRVGASDNLSAGESTFMVEMQETARIVNQCTPRSLIILDEIGRGTSTFDGISIAWALVEYLHTNPRCQARTLFATHYHELAELAHRLERVHNYTVAVREIEGRILFLRKLVVGHSEHSFGIHVARMAGMPTVLVDRATEILREFEQQRTLANPGAPAFPSAHLDDLTPDSAGETPAQAARPEPVAEPIPLPRSPLPPALETTEHKVQLKLFEAPDDFGHKVRQILQDIDLDRMTPLDAMLKLAEIHHIFKGYTGG